MTLFPFDFAFGRDETPLEIIQDFFSSLNDLYVHSDFPGNILLFVPFGFGVAGLAHGYKLSNLNGFMLALISGAAVSVSIEILQALTYSRYSTFVDVFANTLGAAGGAILFQFIGSASLTKLELLTQKLFRNASPWRLFGLAVFWAVLLICITIPFKNSFSLENWNSHFPLLVGNEQNGDWIWEGTISKILFLDRALSNSEVEQYFSGNTLQDINGKDILAYYEFDGVNALMDRTKSLPDFNNRGNTPIMISQNGVQLGEEQWLETDAGTLIDRIRQSSEFTLYVDLQAENNLQEGPSRIVSISTDAFQRNLTLGQEKNDLIIRIRSPITGANGRNPELVIPGVFDNSLAHQLVLSYQPNQIRAYIDGPENLYRFPLTPQLAMLWFLFPKTEQVYMVPSTPILLNLIFLCLILVPLVLGLYLLLNHYVRGKYSIRFN